MTDSSPQTSVPRSLLPGELAAASGPPPAGAGGGGDERVRRTTRDWVVDSLLFCWAVLWWAVLLLAVQDYDYLPAWQRAIDAPLGALACLALWWRRRFPLAVALIGLPAGAITNSAFGALMVIILNLAMRVPWRPALLVLCLYIAASAPYVLLYSVPYEGGWSTAAFVLAYYLVFFAWGTAISARRRLVLKLHEDARRERQDHARRLTDTRRAERAAIAREMHDVLAHRISLLSVHAGALAYRTKQSAAGAGPALGDAEVAESAQVIRDNAHQALDELREVLHVLRADEDEPDADAATAVPAPPQPQLVGITGMVDEARAAGQQIDFRDGITDQPIDTLRPQLQRTVYRVVQEGLTNARKHAPGAQVTIQLAGAPGTDLTVRVSNPLPAGVTAPEIPGAGAGLTGLRERVELDGGTLEHGSTDGTFTLWARLRWPTSA
ncbi:sensor histidine kinase [Streptomyces gobiensis]|uniref:sensor histidine kinase n=1 Tax=Streptomyces gobiensis TaxID=2875706 RepID=UPI001E43531B|nr:sensor histidine kinase [Streptomyces gobiensis]UGY92143.1 histidine kinase [Streptomyces gobiensis]